MCSRVITSGLRLLIGAVLWSLLALSAVAYPGHVHRNDTSEAVAVSTFATGVHRDFTGAARLIAISAVQSGCGTCSGQNGCCAGSGCGLGMTCGAASCSPGGGAALVLCAAGLTLPTTAAIACHYDQLLVGHTLGPDDRPPRF